MTELLADYMALPEVQFFIKHWFAYLVVIVFFGGLAFLSTKVDKWMTKR
jgi:hypothetical protein